MACQLFAALTLARGHAVQLYKGSLAQKTVLPQAPARLAEHFAAGGAAGILVLDLDGELAGAPHNLKTVAGICRAGVPVWVGGGVTSVAAAEAFFGVGATGVAAGTAAVEQANLLPELLAKFGARQIAGWLTAHASGEQVLLQAGQRETTLETVAVAQQWATLGLTRLFFTDLPRVGTLTFPNFEVSEQLARLPNLQVVTGGGVTQLKQVQLLATAGCAGVVIGRALTERAVDLTAWQSSL